ncbi:enoyl-CoA hydratase/isomerase family protein [Mesorhizobium sp. BR1-1-9]|uniref:enoyl-CoA hydratase/isomerase family protein n=1 Tax=Mesorhizobium sp. BR1-1-9 TaxID=2876646 RepID=UPI001CD17212|nr:enoyl-CoA hydratase/isomerase family protein [Mesorhizobium sp. BR1-1-9]MBZ9870411.1 enoyl-CoA hydratase/isomerase family protein [Mesorhizobium sp. BR1-1-9]
MVTSPAIEFFHIELRNGVALVTIDRPPVNAMSREVYESLDRVIDHIEATEEIRAVVLACKAEARAWIGGGDLNEFLTLNSETRRDRHAYVESVTDRFYNLSCPTIAAVSMPAPGGGMVIASFCDIIVAADTAFFSMPEVDRSLTGGAGAYLLRLHLPVPFIREMILTGRKVSAKELHDVGFVNYVVPKDGVLSKAFEIAEAIAAKSAAAVRAIKKSANLMDRAGWDEGRAAAHKLSETLVDGPDYKEAISAFLERRKPSFTGR